MNSAGSGTLLIKAFSSAQSPPDGACVYYCELLSLVVVVAYNAFGNDQNRVSERGTLILLIYSTITLRLEYLAASRLLNFFGILFNCTLAMPSSL